MGPVTALQQHVMVLQAQLNLLVSQRSPQAGAYGPVVFNPYRQSPYGGPYASIPRPPVEPNQGFTGDQSTLITDAGGGDYEQPAGFLGLGRETVHGKGVGADLTGDGVSDGNLAFDYDHDGKISNKDIDETNKAIKAHNGEMEQTACNRNEVDSYKDKYNQIDSNGDGRLQSSEINSHGGKIAVDRGNGTFMIHDFNKFRAR